MTDTSADTVKGDAVHAASPRASSTLADWRDYVSLMKPRVMTLVVFTGLAGLVAAPGSMNPIAAAIAILCIAVGAGAAGAFNMAYDADIDAVMKRTRRRPVPTGRVPREEAYVFAGVMSLGSVLLMALATNYVAAGLLAFSIFFLLRDLYDVAEALDASEYRDWGRCWRFPSHDRLGSCDRHDHAG